MKTWNVVLLTLIVGAIFMTLCAVLLIQHGFRATDAPSALEIAVAQTARNIAIPRRERNEKNPFEASSDAIGQGREAF